MIQKNIFNRSFVTQVKNGCRFFIHLTPSSSTLGLKGILTDERGQEYLRIYLHAPPIEGRANRDLIEYLSKILKISKSSISIIRGEKNRYKIVEYTGSILSKDFLQILTV